MVLSPTYPLKYPAPSNGTGQELARRQHRLSSSTDELRSDWWESNSAVVCSVLRGCGCHIGSVFS